MDFSEAIFGAPTSFAEACFLSRFPDFTNVIWHDKTVFTTGETNWPVVDTRVLPKIKISGHFKTPPKTVMYHAPSVAKGSAAALRHVMAKQALPEEEHFFFRREMHHAARSGPVVPRIPILAYEVLSNFGYSISRPVHWLIGVFAFGLGTLFAGLLQTYTPWPAMGLAVATSFSNLLPVFGFGRVFLGDVLQELPVSLKVISGLQTVVALPLLFFLGLGLRTRFRLR